jgi:hypothetical protein
MSNNSNFNLGQYVRDVFDLNKDGKVTFNEFVATMIPNYAVAIAFIVVDLLMLVAEYRVWDVGITITGDPYKAMGFLLVSAVPFYLAQILWLYPRANGWQQAIAVAMAIAALVTSAKFGLADLSKSYDIDRIVTWVIWLSGTYIVALLVYIVIDKNIRLMRAKVKAREQANFQGELNKSMRSILSDLREGLKEEADLRREFGDLAVDSHLQMMRGMADKTTTPFRPSAQLDVPRDNNHHSQQLPPKVEAGNPIQPPRQD